MLAVITVTSSCGWGDPSPEESTELLEQQRLDVRAATNELVAASERRLPGALERSVGRFEGCTSRFANSFKDFRYVRETSIVFDDPQAPALDIVSEVLAEGGFSISETPQTSPLGPGIAGGRDSLDATAYVFPEAEDTLSVTIEGQCIDVPKEDSDEWIARQDDEPLG